VNLVLERAGRADEPRLTALLQLYAYDFSEIIGLDVGEDGRFALPSLAVYFDEPRAHAFLLRVDGKLAGFALVQQQSRIDGNRAVTDLAEFCILRRYRRHGLGERAAVELFGRFPGAWEVRQRPENSAATRFWRRVIGTHFGRFDEVALDDDRWRGPVQRFHVRAARAEADVES
jgi:predicted acetyltransferase